MLRRGKELIAQSKLADACAAFDASQKLVDPILCSDRAGLMLEGRYCVMSTSTRVSMSLILAAACGYPRPSNVSVVRGQVHGLWNGTDGVALRLQADGIDTLLTVPVDGAFSFAESLVQGASYTVTIATNPARHACVVDEGGNGTVAANDTTNVSIVCTGPAVTIALSGPWGWTFDPTQETQTFAGSVATQDVAFTISGNGLTGANVGGTAATLGKQTSPITLPLGTTTVPVVLTAGGGLSKTYQLLFDRGEKVLEQAVYGKASNTGQRDHFGVSVALAGDTLAVGASDEASNSTGVDGNQGDNTASGAGAVYVFVRSGTTWTQQAYIKASNTEPGDQFGLAIALYGDTLAVGAYGEDSNATDVNGNQADNSAADSGAVYMFVRHGTAWTQEAYVKPAFTRAGSNFGWRIALSGDTLAVGARGEFSQAGAVYIFIRGVTTWTEQALLIGSNTVANDFFGYSVALSRDTLAVGAVFAANDTGAVYVFVRNGTTWSQQAYLKGSNTEETDLFGKSVALSGDTLAVSAVGEASRATGVDGNQADNSASGAGAVYVFVRNGTTWAQQAYVKASNTDVNDSFGESVALSGDTLAVGTHSESSSATGINGNQLDNSVISAGAVYLFVRNGTMWTQQAYIKASNTGVGNQFGSSVALSDSTLVIGAQNEFSIATGVNPATGQADRSAPLAGAIYIFR